MENGPATPELVSQRPSQRRPLEAALLIALSALALGYLAHLHGRPVTAALLAVFAVTSTGALLGLRVGVIAGLITSATYNLLFTDPYLQFSVASADDFVPIIALNLSAIGSGFIAGRLRDRAVAAEVTNRRIAELLRFSQDVQRAISLKQIENVLHESLQQAAHGLKFTLVRAERSPTLPEQTGFKRRASNQVHATRFPLESGDGTAAELLVEGPAAVAEAVVSPLVPIVAMATQRCILAADVAEADLIRKSEKFKTALLSSVSHDLRTPLAAISASASSLVALGQQLDTHTQNELLQTIQEQCERLDRLTGNLLYLGRIDGGLDLPRMPIIDAMEVLGSALARVRAGHSTHRFERRFELASAAVRADEPLLEQVFVNILQNAVVHTEAGTTVKVSAGRHASLLKVVIEDNGPGIPPEDQDRVFDRFYQVSTQTPSRSGSGLGLSIAKGFAEAVGGSVWASQAERPLNGARIQICLPIAREP